MQTSYQFPEGFLWGCATAAYQVEGAFDADGRGLSIWDTFSKSPGRVAMDHNGDVAVDQYHRYKEDVQLMKWLGLKAYRFSVSWPRVFPQGHGKPNPKGLDHYERLVDELLANGVQPWATLFHWDLPQALEDQFGGWRSPEIAKHFADYAAFVSAKLSDRVKNFFTINEFLCFTDLGYRAGGPFPPDAKLTGQAANQTRHNALLAHGLAVKAIRDNSPADVKVGLAENSTIPVPVIETPEHVAAARSAMRDLNAHFLTAVMEGKYSDAYLQREGANAPVFTDAEMKAIGAKLDFVGLNVYAPTYVMADASAPQGYKVVPHPESYPKLDMPWLFFGPQITYWAPRHMKEIWDVDAVYFTENGCAAQDKLTVDNKVLDTDRVLYLREHFIAAHRAVAEGWPLKGYFVWSLLDNFEWACGYTKRFGIVYVNYTTQERVPKLSAEFYREVIKQNRVM